MCALIIFTHSVDIGKQPVYFKLSKNSKTVQKNVESRMMRQLSVINREQRIL